MKRLGTTVLGDNILFLDYLISEISDLNINRLVMTPQNVILSIDKN